VLHDRIGWYYSSLDGNHENSIIYWQNNIYNADKKRFSVVNRENSVFDLVVDSVQVADAGVYRCRENNGRYPGESCTEVIVVIPVGESYQAFIWTYYIRSIQQGHGHTYGDLPFSVWAGHVHNFVPSKNDDLELLFPVLSQQSSTADQAVITSPNAEILK